MLLTYVFSFEGMSVLFQALSRLEANIGSSRQLLSSTMVTYVFSFEGLCVLFQALSRLEANIGSSRQLHSSTFVDKPHSSDQLPENIVLDKFDGLMSGEDESSISDAGDDPKSSPANSPTLSVILGMDAVGRVSMLRKQITAVQSLSALTMDDCLWLFALCAAVDTPVDADTCASLRSLLRKCANLRADKSKLDDEVIMLNILVTICGRYFGQSEQRQFC